MGYFTCTNFEERGFVMNTRLDEFCTPECECVMSATDVALFLPFRGNKVRQTSAKAGIWRKGKRPRFY